MSTHTSSSSSSPPSSSSSHIISSSSSSSSSSYPPPRELERSVHWVVKHTGTHQGGGSTPSMVTPYHGGGYGRTGKTWNQNIHTQTIQTPHGASMQRLFGPETPAKPPCPSGRRGEVPWGLMGAHGQGQGCFGHGCGRLGVSETVGNLSEISDGGLKQPLNRRPGCRKSVGNCRKPSGGIVQAPWDLKGRRGFNTQGPRDVLVRGQAPGACIAHTIDGYIYIIYYLYR